MNLRNIMLSKIKQMYTTTYIIWVCLLEIPRKEKPVQKESKLNGCLGLGQKQELPVNSQELPTG